MQELGSPVNPKPKLQEAICLYYLAFYGVKAVEDEYAKREICEEFPQFAIFEETGKFPEVG